MALLRKMDNIRGRELRFFSSYLENRSQVVEIENFISQSKQSPDMGCIQGSTMANTIYPLYNLQVPVLCVDELSKYIGLD